MTLVYDILALLASGSAGQPEHRRIALCTRPKVLRFAEPTADDGMPKPALAEVCQAFAVLEAAFDTRASGSQGYSAWQRYLELPRQTATDKRIAEFYRIARMIRTLIFLPGARVDMGDGVISMTGIQDKVVLSVDITPSGLDLLVAGIKYYLSSLNSPYPEAYVSAVLSAYYADLIDEIPRFSDEKRVPFQFRREVFFNRHYRLDCDNPKTTISGGRLVFDIGDAYRGSPLFPIDFFVPVDDILHIVPVEVLQDGAIDLDELPLWRARLKDGRTLPFSFRHRFVHDAPIVNQPMT